jgi:hypothetical protein
MEALPVTLLNLAWMLTALAAVVVMLTRSRLIASQKQSGVTETPNGLLNAHTMIGVLALATWVGWLAGAPRWVGTTGVVLWWVVVAIGLFILARWLPSGGRHATGARDDGWAHGPWLSVLAHLGMVGGIAFFTWFLVAGQL